GVTRGRDAGARFRVRHPPVGRAVRRPRHRGGQRHLPAMVRAGGRGHSQGRHRREPVARQHRLVPAAAATATTRRLRARQGPLAGDGVVRNLHLQARAESDSIKAVPGLGYVNVPRTEALAFQVYHRAAAAGNRPRGWVDRPSEGILATYGIVYQALAQVLQKRNPQEATQALVVADSIFKNTTFGFTPPTER